jgi:hypothetical protein
MWVLLAYAIFALCWHPGFRARAVNRVRAGHVGLCFLRLLLISKIRVRARISGACEALYDYEGVAQWSLEHQG